MDYTQNDKSIIIKYKCDWSYIVPPEEYDSFKMEDKLFTVEKGGQIVAVVNVDYVIGIFIERSGYETVKKPCPKYISSGYLFPESPIKWTCGPSYC